MKCPCVIKKNVHSLINFVIFPSRHTVHTYSTSIHSFIHFIGLDFPALFLPFTPSFSQSLCSPSHSSTHLHSLLPSPSSYSESAGCLCQSMSGTEPEMAPSPQVTSSASRAFLGLMTRWYWKGRRMAMYRSAATANKLRMELWKRKEHLFKDTLSPWCFDDKIKQNFLVFNGSISYS